MMFRVVVTAEAERNLIAIGDWLHERSPEGAKSWLQAAWKAIDGLGTQAQACPFAPENPHSALEIRNTLFRTRRGRTYRAVFTIENDTVTVTHVRGPGQQLLPPTEFAPR